MGSLSIMFKYKELFSSSRGHLDGTSDPDMIAKYSGKYPQTNIVSFLSGSRLVAVAVDNYKPDCQWKD